MKTSPAIAISAAASALAALLLAPSAGGQAPQGRTIVLTEQNRGATFAFVDNPPKTRLSRGGEPRRASVGDMQVFTIPLLNESRARVGRLAVQCVVTAPGPVSRAHVLCTGAVTLAEGLISLVATITSNSNTVTAAVTGGTGSYAGARGTFTSVSRGNTSTDTIQLLP
jgi:hypothetical protein